MALDTLTAMSEIIDLEIAGDVAYICGNAGGLQLVDISDPANLSHITDFADQGRCDHLVVDPGRSLFLATGPQAQATNSAVLWMDLTDPRVPIQKYGMLSDARVEGITQRGDHVYVAAHDDGVLVLRAEDDRLFEVGRVHTGGNAWQVRLGPGDLAYVANGQEGLAVIDVRVPDEPALVGALALPGSAGDLEIRGDRAFVALRGGGVALVDLSEPESPSLLHVQDTPGSVVGVAPTDDGAAVLVSDWNDLRLFDVVDDQLVFAGREELLMVWTLPGTAPYLSARSYGVAIRGDLVLSSNWSELSSLRRVPGVTSADLSVAPRDLTMRAPTSEEASTALVTLRSEGHDPVTVTSVSVDGDAFSVDPFDLPVTLADGATQSFVVRFNGGAGGGPPSGTITIDSDDIDLPQQFVGLRAGVAGLTEGDPVGDPTFLDLDGLPMRLSDVGEGPILLAYFATF